jgi:predicted phage terminase large subunit-like protein
MAKKADQPKLALAIPALAIDPRITSQPTPSDDWRPGNSTPQTNAATPGDRQAEPTITLPDITALRDWASHALAPLDQVPARHHIAMLDRLEDVAAGKIDRLMLLLPPGHGKSAYASVLFPAWWFTRHPASSVIAACHTADLASHFARRVREIVREQAPVLGYNLTRDERAAARWRTTNRSDYYACGIRGPITGRRADLVLIDDPIKSHTEADSQSARDSLWNWYRSDLATRLKPGGRIVLIMTRWHQDDLGGRLLETDPGWTVLKFPALAEADDPLGRKPGEALWPEWENEAALDRKRQTVGPRNWQALFQQNPKPDSDALFTTARILIIEEMPKIIREVRAWDLAATLPTEGRDPDWTVGLKLGITQEGRHIVTDIIRIRAGPTEIANLIVSTANHDGPETLVGLPQDPGQAGKQQIAWLTQRLAGHRVSASPETGSKLLRATLPAAAIDAGSLSLLRASWNRVFLDELREFPQGRKDDQVDALSRAFTSLAQSSTQPHRFNMSLLGR